ncbi:hypothetical protein [Actinomadura geliboluensis]|uniref:hypothetical protein n=1 Tax=Actinomadura geliboluensis TaxID=882440 RepID=UPI003716011D
MDANEALEALDASTRRYRETERAHVEAREETVAAVVAALKAGARPTDVAMHSPFTGSHVRTIAREHGIEPRRKGSGKGAP